MKSNPYLKNTQFKATLRIDHFPSRYEIFSFLEGFLNDNRYPVDYESLNKDNAVTLAFTLPTIALEFAQFLQLKQIESPLYNNIQTIITLELNKVKEPLFKKSYKTIQTVLNTSNSNKELNDYSNVSPEKQMCNAETALNNKLNKKKISLGVGMNGKLVSKSIENSFSKSPSIINKERKNKKNNRLYFRDFNLHFIQEKSSIKNEIPNYVRISHSKYPVYMHQFRDVDSNKWVG